MEKTFKFPRKDWKTVSMDTAQHILRLGTEHFEFTVEESGKITSRAFSFLILLSSILSVLIGYTFNRLDLEIPTSIDYLNITVSIILSVLTVMLLILMFPKQLMVKGHQPRLIATEAFLRPPNLNSDEVYLSYILNNIEFMQTRIDFNKAVNKKRSLLLKLVLWVLIILMPLYLISALIIIL